VELLEDLVDVVNYEVPEGKPGIDWQPPESSAPYRILGDRELIWRAVENLLRNALRHTDADRGVHLTLDSPRRRTGVRIAVRDHGHGVPAAELEKIFEPFYRVQESRDRSSGGHGLGLSIAANAVRRHHGRIAARNAEDGGLIVEIILPASAA
jgi:two-component system sensor histidine kinase CpxA